MKRSSAEYTVFVFLNNFSGKEDFLKCMYKKRPRNIFLLMVHMSYIPNSSSFLSLATSYFKPNRFYLNVCTNHFCTSLLKVKTDNTSK